MLLLKPSTVWLTVLSFVSITSGILIVYSPQLPRSRTTILDERLSIHCNSSCLYNRCGSTDVYVLYSRVHFYYLKIKDCVEEHGGFCSINVTFWFWSFICLLYFEHRMLEWFTVRNKIWIFWKQKSKTKQAWEYPLLCPLLLISQHQKIK